MLSLSFEGHKIGLIRGQVQRAGRVVVTKGGSSLRIFSNTPLHGVKREISFLKSLSSLNSLQYIMRRVERTLCELVGKGKLDASWREDVRVEMGVGGLASIVP